MKIIGLAGKAGCGKDTVAQMILDKTAGVRLAFADPLKQAAREIFGLTDEQMTHRELKEQPVPYWGRSPRQILQLLGTECIREHFGHDTWLKRAALSLQVLNESRPRPSVAVFADVRFAGEAQWIAEQGGVVVEIFRPGAEAVASHTSEAGIPSGQVNFRLLNGASFDALRATVAAELPLWLQCARLRGEL